MPSFPLSPLLIKWSWILQLPFSSFLHCLMRHNYNLRCPFVMGFGLRSMVLTSPAAWWSALAQAFHFISLLIPSLDVLGADVPFVRSQSRCHSFFNKYNVPLNGPVPPDPNKFWSTYLNDPAPSGTQRTLMV